MDFFFIDDAGQPKPSRPGMGPLVAVGGVHVPDESIRGLEDSLDALCAANHFPPYEIFKWSPGRELWMHKGLVRANRQQFFTNVIELTKEKGAKAIVIIEDTNSKTATGVDNSELDLIQLFLERAHHHLGSRGCEGVIIVAQPSGDRKAESKFLADCLDSLKSGTDYVKPDRIALNVLSTSPRFIRLLQVADVITSCTVAYVSGESQFSPPIFNAIRPMLVSERGRIGGFGLKIHPDFLYANLYHWLLGDTQMTKGGEIYLFPQPGLPYSKDADIP